MHQSKLHISQPPIFCHYKNCCILSFDSQSTNPGIVFLDNGQVIISNFKNNQLNGSAIIFINFQTYVIGNFIRGMLDGNFVMRSKQTTIYWMVKMNRIEGEIVVVSWQGMKARRWIIQDGQGTCTKQIQLQHNAKQAQILSKLSPYTQVIPSLIQFLWQTFSPSLSITTSPITQTTSISIPTNPILQIHLHNQTLIQYGIYSNNQLNDLGFMIQGGNLYQGRFKAGRLDGQGLRKDIGGTYTVYGNYSSGDVRQLDIATGDYQQAKKQIIKYKRQVHIHSLQYQNNYFNERPIMLIKNLLNTIQMNEANYNSLIDEQLSSSKNNKSAKKDISQTVSISNKQKQGKKQQKIKQHPSNNSRFVGNELQKSSQFLQGIKQYTQINKALKKFK